MTVSIITACYNAAGTIGDCLESIRTQRYPAIEHIVVDGASKDDTLAIVESYPHVARVISEHDTGIYDAMNKGIGCATGEIIGLLNADDMYIDNEVIAEVVSLFEQDDIMAVYADLVYVDAVDTDKVVRRWRSGQYNSQRFFYGWMPPHPTFFVRKNVYRQFGCFNTDFRSAADYEFMLRVLVKYGIKATYLPRLIVKMRTGGQSNASLLNRWRANREDRRAWDVNGLTPYFLTIPLKPIRKIVQFIWK